LSRDPLDRYYSPDAADLRVWAEQGVDPWMVHVADEVEAGRLLEGDR